MLPRSSPAPLLACALLLAVLFAPVRAVAATASEVGAEVQLVGMINAERASRGLGPLRMDVRMVPGARRWSSHMAATGVLAHDPNRGGQVPSEAEQVWENVGFTSFGDPVAHLHGMFMGSAAHRATILDPGATDVAIGLAQAGSVTWVTERFTRGAPASIHPAVEPTIAMARALFPGRSATHAVVVRDDDYPDALAAGPLAAAGGPILLNPRGPVVYPGVRAALEETVVPGGTVYLLGGPAAVDPEAEQELVAAGFHVLRLAGPDRTATAAAVAREVVDRYGPHPTVALASSVGWADAVSAGAFGARAIAPVLLTDPHELSPAAAAMLDELDAPDVVAIGGTAALSEAVVDAADARRVEGTTRFHTSAEVARELWGRTDAASAPTWAAVPADDPDGWGWAVSIAPLAARLDAAPLLIGSAGLDPQLGGYLASLGYGGKSAELIVHGPVPEALIAELRGLLAS